MRIVQLHRSGTSRMALLALAGLLAGCEKGERGYKAAAVPAPRATPSIRSIDSVSNEEFQAYVGQLHFVEEIEAGDRQALLVGTYPGNARYGPLATIQPEIGGYLIADSSLAQGAVIARIINEGAEGYEKLGLQPHSTTYWWARYDSATGNGRSVFVAVDSTGNILSRTVRGLTYVGQHEYFQVNQALARFVWSSEDESSWSSCGNGCCKS